MRSASGGVGRPGGGGVGGAAGVQLWQKPGGTGLPGRTRAVSSGPGAVVLPVLGAALLWRVGVTAPVCRWDPSEPWAAAVQLSRGSATVTPLRRIFCHTPVQMPSERRKESLWKVPKSCPLPRWGQDGEWPLTEQQRWSARSWVEPGGARAPLPPTPPPAVPRSALQAPELTGSTPRPAGPGRGAKQRRELQPPEVPRLPAVTCLQRGPLTCRLKDSLALRSGQPQGR